MTTYEFTWIGLQANIHQGYTVRTYRFRCATAADGKCIDYTAYSFSIAITDKLFSLSLVIEFLTQVFKSLKAEKL